MSELSATNCGCGCDNDFRGFGGNNSCLWIILLLLFCGGCGGSTWGNNGCNDSCLFIILILFFCCGNGFRSGNDCGCGC